jgi:hypothetical protein
MFFELDCHIVPHDASHVHHLASWAHAKYKHGGSKDFVLQEISGSTRGKKKRG